MLDGITSRRVIFGHTHLQFRRTTDAGIELVNPGSVGLPFDGDRRAAYATIDADGNLELQRVEYDVDHAIAALRARAEPWAAGMISVLERGALG